MSLLRRLVVRLVFLGLALLCLAGTAPPAAAQNPFSDLFGSLFAPRRMRPPEEPRPRAIHKPKPKPANPSGAQPAPGAGQAARPAPSFYIAVIGDSQANMLAQGLTEAFANDPRVAIVNKAKEDTGLVRDDFYDWRAAAKALLDGPQHFDAVVIEIGANDNQKIKLGGDNNLEPLSKPFNEIYAKRVEELAALFADRKTPLIWVGQPIMRSESLSNAALVFNDIGKQYAEAHGAHYVDLWEAFSDENSVYRASGPDVNGVIVRLRAADGVHFNKAGARKAAHFVEPEIRKLLEAALTPSEAPPETEGATPPAAPTPPGAGEPQLPGTPQGGEPAEAAAPPPKPLAGKVESLTDPAVSPGGGLISAPAATARPQAAPSQPGRADDFTWPQK